MGEMRVSGRSKLVRLLSLLTNLEDAHDAPLVVPPLIWLVCICSYMVVGQVLEDLDLLHTCVLTQESTP